VRIRLLGVAVVNDAGQDLNGAQQASET
jgi:hypothetical protein